MARVSTIKRPAAMPLTAPPAATGPTTAESTVGRGPVGAGMGASGAGIGEVAPTLTGDGVPPCTTAMARPARFGAGAERAVWASG